jgi:hypothetical protein
MRNNQRKNNQTNQGCVGENLRVCPATVNTIPIIKQLGKGEQLRKGAHAGVPLQAHTKPDNGRIKKQLTQPVQTQYFASHTRNLIFYEWRHKCKHNCQLSITQK